MEILYIMASAYVIYAVAEKLHSSGIIATLFGSMLMGIYARPGRKADAEIMGMLRFLLNEVWPEFNQHLVIVRACKKTVLLLVRLGFSLRTETCGLQCAEAL